MRKEILPALRRRPDELQRLDMDLVRGAGDDAQPVPATPENLALFGRPRRDFSHGCVRVEDPVALAQWLLADQPEWTLDRIVSAMSDETAPSRHVPLIAPVPVILFYTTAMVTPGDHRLHFADDIYHHDARLRRALQQKPPP